MDTTVDEALRAEAAHFRLRFSCEHCAHFEPERGVCGEGFPNGSHRDVPLETARRIVFCKSFELG
jgi:hypothetical protein